MKTFLINIGITLLAFLTPLLPLIVITGAMLTIDLITGIWAAIKNKEKISSRRMSDTITKMVVYSFAILGAYLFQYLISDLIPFAKLAAIFICTVELKSIFENADKLTKIGLVKWFKAIMKRKADEIEQGVKN